MSIVILGGNERMEHTYLNICKEYGHKAKIFTKEHGSFKRKIGKPDLMIFFTNTVSHKMVEAASKEAKRNHIPITKVHTSSTFALHSIFQNSLGHATE